MRNVVVRLVATEREKYIVLNLTNSADFFATVKASELFAAATVSATTNPAKTDKFYVRSLATIK
jgi:hypothetical protein